MTTVTQMFSHGLKAAAIATCATFLAAPLSAQEAQAPAAPSFEAPVAPQAPAAPEVDGTDSAAPEVSPAQDSAPAAPGEAATETAPVAQDDATAPAADESTATDMAAPGEAPVVPEAPAEPEGALERAMTFLENGGPAIWAITALSVVTLALILWKTWSLSMAGAWSRRPSSEAVALWEQGRADAALKRLEKRHGLRSRMTRTALTARMRLDDDQAREETTRVAKRLLADQSGGLRALELIATIAPLLGLLGTVLGMIAAFQALQEAGNRADPALLAGGIWEALLTTAAGMAVAIPASAALTWFESVIENVRVDMEDLAARIFVADRPHVAAATLHEIDLAAE
ncbi:MotA/TolQ/ExbB proton channel family protein [Pseudooceanicola sp. LIPI14-2-Ac024]|uniref:MotA/TolQ/ExbB proton channel family protein n=1 Tax=Pseudooceanicola sp. LIPI14-2-Ac024 TaxID=3344875 RepID=UPI0035CFF6EF